MAAESSAFAHGLLINLGLLLAIGPQTIFVITRAVRRETVWPVITTCVICDGVLIGLGVFGVGGFLATSSLSQQIFLWAGALFLFGYGAAAILQALRAQDRTAAVHEVRATTRMVVCTLAVTLLNPLVYLDCLVLMGGIAASHSETCRPYFLAGALLGSLFWFQGLALCSSAASRFLQQEQTLRLANICVAVVMWSLAANILWGMTSAHI